MVVGQEMQKEKTYGFMLPARDCFKTEMRFGQELQGNVAPQSQVLSPVDHADTAATQLLQDAVMRYGSA